MTHLILTSSSVSVVIALDEEGARIVHWGSDAGSVMPDPALTRPPIAVSSHDLPVLANLLPEASAGWTGAPGLVGHRDGRAFSPRFRVTSHRVDHGAIATIAQHDPFCELDLITTVELTEHGLLRIRHELVNVGTDPYTTQSLVVCLPVPARAAEVLDLTGRWAREAHPQRMPLGQGRWVRAERRARTGHDSALLMSVGTPGFSFERGEVWSTHLAWSSDHEMFVERVPDGRRLIGGSELSGPRGLVLLPGDRYSTPWLFGAYSGAGLNGISAAFHRWVRARPRHPSTPRPVVLNTWEAVYFRHDLTELTELASQAAQIGVERFVLDDGWFLGRRTDRAGLGDWVVDPQVWPDGLSPLIDRVHEMGMEFGLWVEPEMINADSDAARAHPDWIAAARDEHPIPWRSQQVLDLCDSSAWQYVFDRLDALLTEYPIDFLKWDHNRDLADLAHDGRASAHDQMLAVYALIDRLRAAHPHVEIESCSSGGARIDLEILERTDRVWTSDTNDALERQTIQQWTQVVIPPELTGAHVGPPTSHTTSRTHGLALRTITALFAHFGIEWDIRRLDAQQIAAVAESVAVYRRHRDLVHSGRLIRADSADASRSLYGVVAEDAGRAVFAYVALCTSPDEMPGAVRIPGLDRLSDYRVTVDYDGGSATYLQNQPPSWVASGIRATGAYLGEIGLEMPVLNPEQAILLLVERVQPYADDVSDNAAYS